MDIQGLIWNCRGLKKKGTSTYLKNLISQHHFHFVGLQETMIEVCEDSLIRKFDTQQEYIWLWNPSKGKSESILVGVKMDSFDVGSFKQGEFMIQLNLWDKRMKSKWNLVVVYGAAQDEGKIPFLSELSNFCSNSQEPTLIGGDFNIIRFAHEKNTNCGVHEYTQLFNSLINFYELREIALSGGGYTWTNNQDPPTLTLPL